MPSVWVSGEISNFTRAASGHWYFTLKDDSAQVRSVMFRSRAQLIDFTPREGDCVEVRGSVSLYTARGDFQLNVDLIRRAGMGSLFEAFLKLKERLSAEGLFDPACKHPIPSFVRSIGIVTSPQAAALRDVLTTLQRRAPHVRIVLYPTPVQGAGAARSIAAAIAAASRRAECDVLVICRGGGSIEDLWCFNDEVVARSIAASRLPIISGVGHETDFTITDFVADLRAPTPTAAAELAAPLREEWLAQLNSYAKNMTAIVRRRLTDATQTLDWQARRLISPVAYISQQRVKLETFAARMQRVGKMPVRSARTALTNLQARLSVQRPDVTAYRMRVNEQSRRFSAGIKTEISQRRQALETSSSLLELLNPQRTLDRGYAMITDANGSVVRSPDALRAKEKITVSLSRGQAQIGIATVSVLRSEKEVP